MQIIMVVFPCLPMFYRTLIHFNVYLLGPWIENIYIDKFLDLNLSNFGGLIPIFAQWIDIEIISHRDYFQKQDEILSLIRPNVLYVTVSQGDKGIGSLSLRAPNILVLSSGGYGNVPLPLIRGEMSYYPPPSNFSYDISFYGSIRNSREVILNIISEFCKNNDLVYTQGLGKYPVSNDNVSYCYLDFIFVLRQRMA